MSSLSLDGHVTHRQRLEPCSHTVRNLVCDIKGEGARFGGRSTVHSLLTAINLLGSLLLLDACVVLVGGLGCDTGGGAVLVEVASLVHGLLERVALPAEDVITVSGSTAEVHGVDERVRAIGGEDALVHEVGDVPHDLVHDLGELDGMGRGAGTAAIGTSTTAVGDVAPVVGRVEVLAIPAGGEDKGLADHLAAEIHGDLNTVPARARGTSYKVVVVCRGPASVADGARLDLLGIGISGITSNHAEALGSNC